MRILERLLGTGPSQAPIDLPAMGNPQDQNARDLILDVHHDAPVADSVSP